MTHTGTFYFNPDDHIYQTHFPGSPTVPGSLVVHAFVSEIRKTAQEAASLKIESFSFLRFITPGSYTFSIEQEKNKFRCRLALPGQRSAAKGTIVCG